MSKITKAVIPCGGMGTRFLPITKSVPKEILPVIDTPVLGHIVNEAVDSGITDILIVLGKGKETIKNYFTDNNELEDSLLKAGKTEFVEILRKIKNGANISFELQEKPLGSGDAVLYGEKFTGKEPFVLSWGDDLIFSNTPVMKQLMDAFEVLNAEIFGVQYYGGADVNKYGLADVIENAKNPLKNAHLCKGVKEKPPIDCLPSRLAAFGRYILTSNVYEALRNTPKATNGEHQLTDALNLMSGYTKVYAVEFEGKRYDMGDKFGAVQATVEYSLRRNDFGNQMKDYIKELAKNL